MNRLDASVSRHPAIFSLAVVIAFLLLLMGPEVLVNGKSDSVIEAVGALERVIITAIAWLVIRALGWTDLSGVRGPGTATSWAIIAPPLLYLGAVYPYLFTRSWAPNLREPSLTALVGLDGLSSGAVGEFVYRALIFVAFLRAWGRSRTAVVKAAVASSIFFAVPHLTNMLFGQQPMRVLAQVLWAFILGIAFAWLYFVGASIWPVAFLHGALDAFVAMNRMGTKVEITPAKGLLMIAAALPVPIYAWIIVRRFKSGGESSPPL